MSHYVYTCPGVDDRLVVLGASMDIDDDAADRIALDLERKVGDPVTAHPVPAYTPQPVRVGDTVSGRTANTLPRGTAIGRVARVDGVAVKVSSALLRVVNGWVSGTDTTECPGGLINEDARYEVLFLGEPWVGPPSTAHRR